ncbi:MAG TPA: hypothetical protein VNH44_11190 [Micropepsaceae bacterium]|nr:hypothetical protein [Micropepsaceae bacterium]
MTLKRQIMLLEKRVRSLSKQIDEVMYVIKTNEPSQKKRQSKPKKLSLEAPKALRATKSRRTWTASDWLREAEAQDRAKRNWEKAGLIKDARKCEKAAKLAREEANRLTSNRRIA